MGNTRPGAVRHRHSSRQAAHRARVRASHFGPRETTATPQHGSRASAVTRRHPATTLHAWSTVSPPICLARDPESCPSEACERKKKDCQGETEGEGGRLGGEGALDLPPPDRRRGGPLKNRGDSSKNELVVLDLPQHGRATRELRGKVSHSRGPSARVKKFLHPGAFEGSLARTCRRVCDLEKGLPQLGTRAVATAPLNQRKAPARPTCDAGRGRGAVA